MDHAFVDYARAEKGSVGVHGISIQGICKNRMNIQEMSTLIQSVFILFEYLTLEIVDFVDRCADTKKHRYIDT